MAIKTSYTGTADELIQSQSSLINYEFYYKTCNKVWNLMKFDEVRIRFALL